MDLNYKFFVFIFKKSFSDEFTIFAPSDEAFNRLEPALLAGIKSNRELLTTILTAHIVRDRLPSSNITNDTVSSALLNGYKLKFVVDQDGTMVNGVNVTRPDLLASNGIIHVIDKVIIPQKPVSKKKLLRLHLNVI